MESHAAAMDRLTGLFKLPTGPKDDTIAEAIARQARRVAYVRRKQPKAGNKLGDKRCHNP